MSIGMVMPDITNPFFPPVVRGAEDVLDRAGYSLLLSSSDNDLGKARRQTAAMLEGQADGLLLAMARRDDPLVADLRAGGTPLAGQPDHRSRWCVGGGPRRLPRGR